MLETLLFLDVAADFAAVVTLVLLVRDRYPI